MYQVKIDNSNKSAVFGKKMGAEFSASILFIPKELLETHS